MKQNNPIQITAIRRNDAGLVRPFTDKWIGKNYFSDDELSEILERSTLNGVSASFGAFQGESLVGIRLTMAPGRWQDLVGRGLSENLWNFPAEEVAYFKSLFVAEAFQGQGIGRRLSEASLRVLKKMGAMAVICHSWLESPENSSQEYLRKMGFRELAIHPRFWSLIDYQCTRCAPDSCSCTAIEMIKVIEDNL